MAPHVARQRDVFPLRSFDKITFDRSLLSRCVIRSLTAKNKTLDWANLGVASLNELSGVDNLDVSSSDAGPRGAQLAQDNILKNYASMGKPANDFSPEGALHELLGKSSFYDASRTDIQPYSKERCSWPDNGSSPIPLIDHIHPADRSQLFNWQVSMLRSNTDYRKFKQSSPVVKPYIDPTLMSTPHTYASFLKRLDSAGMLRWTVSQTPGHALGVFFIRRKDDSLRIISDTRLLNLHFQRTPQNSFAYRRLF